MKNNLVLMDKIIIILGHKKDKSNILLYEYVKKKRTIIILISNY